MKARATVVMDDLEYSRPRRFGLVVGGAFLLIGVWPVLRHWSEGSDPRLWALALGIPLAVLALAWPAALTRPMRLWTRLGHALGFVNSRLILGLLYLGFIVPVGLFRRLILRSDPLALRFDASRSTYFSRSRKRDSKHFLRSF